MIKENLNKKYDNDEFEIIKYDKKIKLVRCKADNKLRFLNDKNIEKRNFTFSINDLDREDENIMEFIMNQEDFNKAIHRLILTRIEEHGTKPIKIDRFGNYVEE